MKNMHGAEFEPAQERMDKLRDQIREQLAQLAELNEADGNIGEACTALAALHNTWSRKHVLMKQMQGRMDLDRYAANGG